MKRTKTITPRIGDRFKIDQLVLETIAVSGGFQNMPIQRVLENDPYATMNCVGEEESWDCYEDRAWIYLGNFSKNTNFQRLYEKLQG